MSRISTNSCSEWLNPISSNLSALTKGTGDLSTLTKGAMNSQTFRKNSGFVSTFYEFVSTFEGKMGSFINDTDYKDSTKIPSRVVSNENQQPY